MKSTVSKRFGFTLIELLIVVAIIAILAAIAVPNFLEAQTRSKVSRVRADLRSLATGLESYYTDNNAYPKGNNFGLMGARFDPAEQAIAGRQVLERLSTPIAYMTSAFLADPFIAQQRTGTINSTTGSFTPSPTISPDLNQSLSKLFQYFTPGPTGLQDTEAPLEKAKWFWVLTSCGPDRIYPNLGGLFATGTTGTAVLANLYDPTNGTVSNGDVHRLGGTTTGDANYGSMFFRVVSQTGK